MKVCHHMLTRNGTRSGYLLFFFVKQKFCITTNVDDSFLFEISSLCTCLLLNCLCFSRMHYFLGIANRKWGIFMAASTIDAIHFILYRHDMNAEPLKQYIQSCIFISILKMVFYVGCMMLCNLFELQL